MREERRSTGNPPLSKILRNLLRFLENWLNLHSPASRQISLPSRIHLGWISVASRMDLASISPNLGFISAGLAGKANEERGTAVSGQWSAVSPQSSVAVGFTNGAIPTVGPLQIKHLRSARCKKWCNNGSRCLTTDNPEQHKSCPTCRATRTTRNGGSKPELLATKY